MAKEQICIVCDGDIDIDDVASGVRPGDLVICKDCDKITPNRRQAEDHYRRRVRRWYRHMKIEEAAKTAYTHLYHLDRCGALTREDEPMLQALQKALELPTSPPESQQAP